MDTWIMPAIKDRRGNREWNRVKARCRGNRLNIGK